MTNERSPASNCALRARVAREPYGVRADIATPPITTRYMHSWATLWPELAHELVRNLKAFDMEPQAPAEISVIGRPRGSAQTPERIWAARLMSCRRERRLSAWSGLVFSGFMECTLRPPDK